jgi:heme/copper-type cytochrome/quinol oxidase subunit 1
VHAPMLTTKLFEVSAIFFALAGLIRRHGALPSFDIALHGTYFVISRSHLLLVSAVVCALYALLYYLSAKTLHLQASNVLSVVQFAMTFLGLLGLNWLTNARIGPGRAIYLAEASVGEQSMLSMVKIALCGYISFFLGAALFILIMAWAVSLKLLRKNV